VVAKGRISIDSHFASRGTLYADPVLDHLGSSAADFLEASRQ